MAVDVGSAVGYLDLDISGFIAGLQSANSQAAKSMNSIESLGNKITGVGKNISSVGSTLTKTVTLPLAGIAGAGLKVATDFEKGMSEVQAITKAVGQDFTDLRNLAIDLGASTAFSAGEVTGAMTEMAKAGWTTNDILVGMSGVLDAAAASGESLATVSTIVADAITGFGLGAGDSARVADLLTQAANSGTIGITDLGESFKYIAPVAQSMDLSIEDCTTAIAAMSMAGIKGSQAGTSLRTMLTNLVKPTDAIEASMKELGIEVTNSDGSMKELDEIVGILRDSFDGLTEEEKAFHAATLAGKEGMSGLLALLNLTEDEYDEIAASMDNAKGVAQETAEVMQDNLQSKFEQLMGSLESLAIVLADNVIPPLTQFVEWLTGCIEKFTQLDPATQKTILTIAGIVAALGPVILIVGKLVQGIGGAVTAIGKISSMFGKFGSAASSAAAPAASAAGGMGSIAKSAMGLLAAGAGIMLAATGLALLAQSAIALANAGGPAIAIMGGLVIALVGLGAGAAAIAPALTAGSVGLIAFGGAVALVGVGILAATAGVALLATQLPTIAQYGSQAAIALVELGAALSVFGAGTLYAGAGCVALGAGLLVVGTGALTAAVGITALSVGVLALSVGVIALGAGLTLCGAGMTLLAATSGTATSGLVGFTAAASAAFVPITAGAASLLALDAALLASIVTFGVFTVELGLAAVAAGLLSVAMVATAASVSSIENSASSAASSLNEMVSSVSVVESGLKGLKSTASNAMSSFISAISGAKASAKSEANSLASGISSGIETGLAPAVPFVQSSMDEMNSAVSSGMSQMNSSVSSGMSQINSTIRSGFASATSYIKSLAGQAPGWGADIIIGIANGIRANLGTLSSAVNAAANTIRSRLHFSVPDEGPLTDYESWMPDFMQGLAKGIDGNSHLVKSSMQDLAEDMVLEPKDGAFGDSSGLDEYNITLVNTIELYKQLAEQMRLCSQYSLSVVSGDNGLNPIGNQQPSTPAVTEEKDTGNKDENKKPDQLVIPISIGEEQIETVVVDLLRREVRS